MTSEEKQTNFRKTYSFLWENKAAVLLIICFMLIYFACRKPTERVVQIDNPLTLQQIDKYRAENDQMVSQITQSVVTVAQAKKANDSLAKLLKIKAKFIQGADKFTLQVDTVYRDLPSTTVFIGKDTFYKIEEHNNWTDIVAVAGRRSGVISYKYRDSILRVEKVRIPLFGQITREILLQSANPNSSISYGSSFTIKEKKPWLCIGPYIGYDPFINKVSVGIAATLPILTFKK